jgi:DNA-binding beta-propeller fold protein YncE
MRTLLTVCAALLLLPATTQARVVVIAADRPEAALLDVSTNAVAARVALPGRAKAVATTNDGSRAYLAAGRGITAIDLGTRAVAGRAALPARATTVATSPDGARVYATHGRALAVIDAATLRPSRQSGSPAPPPRRSRSHPKGPVRSSRTSAARRSSTSRPNEYTGT